MAFDEGLAQRIRNTLAGQPGLTEKLMFGGIGFLVNGNMACGVYHDEMILRPGPEKSAQALEQDGVKVFDMTGRPMRGWVLIASRVLGTEEQLKSWVQQGLEFSLTLPPK